MMDEAFISFQDLIAGALSFRGEIVDVEAGVRSCIYEFRVEMPVELSLDRDPLGTLRIGSTPPLYYVDTTFRPSFHQLQVTARLEQESDGDT